MLKRLLLRLRSDHGDSMVSAIIVLPLLVAMLLTIIDSSIYLANRGQVQAIARDGARTVAIMGGNGNASMGTALEAKYGQSRAAACSGLTGGRASAALRDTSTPIECNIIRALNSATGLVNTNIDAVTCTPQVTTFIGQRVACEVKWTYNGIPGSAISFLQLGKQNTTAGSAESEVMLATGDLVAR